MNQQLPSARSASPSLPANNVVARGGTGSPMQFRGGVIVGGVPRRGAGGQQFISPPGARGMMPHGGAGTVGGIHPPALPPSAHLLKNLPPQARAAGGAGRGAALSIGNNNSSGGGLHPQMMGGDGAGSLMPPGSRGAGNAFPGRGGAPLPAAAMRGKMPVSSPPSWQPQYLSMQMKMPPGQVGKAPVMMIGKVMAPAPQAMKTSTPASASPNARRPTSVPAGGSTLSPGVAQRNPSPGVAPLQERQPPPLIHGSRGGSTTSVSAAGSNRNTGASPHPPQFAVVNGKKVMVPPGTKLPGPAMASGAPPGTQMTGKKTAMVMGGPPNAHNSLQPDTGPRPMPSSPEPRETQLQSMPNMVSVERPGQQRPQLPSSGAHPLPPWNGNPSPIRPGFNLNLARPMTAGSLPPQQQQQQSLPSVSFSPGHLVQQQSPPPNGKNKKKGGLSGALNLLKLGGDSDKEEKVKNEPPGVAQQQQQQLQQQQQQRPPGGPSPPFPPGGSPNPPRQGQPSGQHQRQQQQPTPPRNSFTTAQGKKIILPPGAKQPPGVKGPPHPQPLLPPSAGPAPSGQQQQQREKLPVNPIRSGPPPTPQQQQQQPPPPAAVKMPTGAHPTPPRFAGIDGNVPGFPSFPLAAAREQATGAASSPLRVASPAAQPQLKVSLKAPPGVVMMKKVQIPPPAANVQQQKTSRSNSHSLNNSRLPSPERPPLASLPTSRSTSLATPPGDSLSGEASHQQQQQRPQALAATRLVKHVMGPLPPGAKLMKSPPRGFTPSKLPPPHPASQLPTPTEMLRVPSSTVLKDGELPEAGVQTPPHPRRHLGESSDDSENNMKQEHHDFNNSCVTSVTRLSQSRINGTAGLKDGSVVVNEEAPIQEGDFGEQQQQQQQQGNNSMKGAGHKPVHDVAVVEDDSDHHNDALHLAAHSSRCSSSITNRSKSANTVDSSSSRSASTNASVKKMKKTSALLPAVRQTTSSAAVAAEAKKKEEVEKKGEQEEDEAHRQRKAAVEAVQRRRQANLAETRRTPKMKAEPASPQEEENTQKPPSVLNRSSASVVSTPSPSHSSNPSTAISPTSEHHSSHPANEKHDTDSSARKSKHTKQHDKSLRPNAQRRKTTTNESADRDRSTSQQRCERRFRRRLLNEDSEDDSGLERLTSRELYMLVNALRDDTVKNKTKSATGANYSAEEWQRKRRQSGSCCRRSDGDTNRSHDGDASNEGSSADADSADAWGLRSNNSSWRNDRGQRSRRRHSLSATRQRQRVKEDEMEARHRRSSLPASTIGIPWRYTSTARASESFASPPPVRRPLGYINVGGGRYARVGGSPYASRHTSVRRQNRGTEGGGCGASSSVTSIPLDASNTSVHQNNYNNDNRRHTRLQNDSLLSDGLDPATSAVLNARDNAVVEEVRANSLGRRGSPVATASVAYYQQQQQQQQQKHRPISVNSPLRFPSPVRPEAGLNESVSTVDSQHPYCVSPSALLSSMQALTPIRRPLLGSAQQLNQTQRSSHQPYHHRLILSSMPSATATAREPIMELSPEKESENQPSRPPQQEQTQAYQQQQHLKPASSNTGNANSISSPVSTRDAGRTPFATLRRSAFFEQLYGHSTSSNKNVSHAPFGGSPVAAIVGGYNNNDNFSSSTPPESHNGAALSRRSGSVGSAGWEWGRRRPATPAESRMSSASNGSAPKPPSSSQNNRYTQQQEKEQEQPSPLLTKNAVENKVGASAVPSLIPTESTPANQVMADCLSASTAAANATAAAEVVPSPAPPACSQDRTSSVIVSTSAACTEQQRRPQKHYQSRSPSRVRAKSVGAAVSTAAAGPRNNNNHYNTGLHCPPSRTKEPTHLTRATIARLSTPQQRRNGSPAAAVAAMLSPTARRSVNGGGSGGDVNSSTAQTCSKWLDDILGSMTVTATGVRAGGEGQDAAAAAAAGTLPIVDLRTQFKPRVAEIEGSAVGGPGKRPLSAAALAIQDPGANDYTRDFTGSKPRPHIPTVSFKHMVGVRSQSPALGATETLARPHALTENDRHNLQNLNRSGVAVKEVHGVEDGLPFEKYSSIRIRDPMRKSPWALAPEREGLDVLPGKPALSRRRRIPSLSGCNGSGNAQAGAADDGDDENKGDGLDGDGAQCKKRRGGGGSADGRTVVEEVHLDEFRRPYLVVRPVPSAEAAEAQRIAVERLSRPKPIYQRAERV